MRMGRVSWLTRRRVPPVPHTHALFADQSQSIPDNLMALLGAVRAWHCSGKAARVPVACYLAHSRFRVLSRHALMVPVLLDMTPKATFPTDFDDGRRSVNRHDSGPATPGVWLSH